MSRPKKQFPITSIGSSTGSGSKARTNRSQFLSRWDLRKDVEKPARDEIKLYDQAIKLYRNKDWDMAELSFLNLQKATPDKALYKLYSERIGIYRKEPPPDPWDGVWTHETK